MASCMFRYPRYVIKGGEIVVEEGEIRNVSDGREFVVQPGLRRDDRGLLCGRCFSSITRCRSRTTPWSWNASNGRKSVPANKRSSGAHDRPDPQRAAQCPARGGSPLRPT